MSPRASRSGVVSLPVLDLRRGPDHASEMRSQLLLGEVVEIRRAAAAGRWLLVRNLEDGYSGWVRSWGIVAASPARGRRWLARARHRVVALHCEVRTSPARGAPVTPLTWGARLIAGPRRGRQRPVELPDGRRGWLATRDLAGVSSRPIRLIDRIQSLIGVPYLWGGRSPAGLDCSSFAQLVLAEQGVRLPRDARDQLEASRPLGSRQGARAGDLVFFGPVGRPGAHVGVYLGLGYYAHSRGRVMLGSLDPDNLLHDNELSGQYQGLARPRPGWRPRRDRNVLTRIPQLP